MSLIYVHLSDIHFGQERGGDLYIHDDIKEQLLEDARDYVTELDNRRANGVIISGDIAYAGKKAQYDEAARWLDRLTAAVGCEITAVQVVPGNHDVDRDKITAITQQAIDKIIKDGDDELDRCMQSEDDREFLYKQFADYRKFAEGYDCPLDSDGKINKHRIEEIAPKRRIKFIGVNTALICSKTDNEEGRLLLGRRQRVIPAEAGLETIVVAHHPLNWLQDSVDANRYISNRARVFISGHEHTPSHRKLEVDQNTDLLMIASGAAVPPDLDPKFNYFYNILEFDWVEASDSLSLTIHGRAWDDEKKKFDLDKVNFTDGVKTYVLNCPNFKKMPITLSKEEDQKNEVSGNKIFETSTMEFSVVDKAGGVLEEKEFQLVLLKFFRDLSSAERLTVLIEFDAIPNAYNGRLTHSMERIVFDKLVQDGRLKEIHDRINQITQQQ
ncbi:hypothetical protein HP439_17585 [Sphingobacterium shayense]|uniref:metallophosphoesterase n=1 Tax=Sphingobacterium shayense TaxID=626343 RepID=UPI00155310C8|nr:metallophosphoesterase [Sphingobacterium shayense]NQD72539.1 hypothetical protein [Sphingobacterium shayense]